MTSAKNFTLEELSERARSLSSKYQVVSLDEGWTISPSSSGKDQKFILFSALIHGNEVGGFYCLAELFKKIGNDEIQIRQPFKVILGNREAFHQKKRYIEKDLNRSFGSSGTATLEERLAKKIEPHIKQAKFVIDLHQTNSPLPHPFFIFQRDEKNISLAHFLDESMAPVVYDSEAFEGLTLGGYAHQCGVPSVTIELGQAGYDESQIQFGVEILKKAIQEPFKEDRKFKKNFYALHSSLASEEGKVQLIPGLINFQPVQKGEVVARQGDKNILSPVDGFILFPVYGERASQAKTLCQFMVRTP